MWLEQGGTGLCMRLLAGMGHEVGCQEASGARHQGVRWTHRIAGNTCSIAISRPEACIVCVGEVSARGYVPQSDTAHCLWFVDTAYCK